MANRDACELYIEQEIDDALKEGKTLNSIGKELAIWIERLFETKIKPATLVSRAYQRKKKLEEEGILNKIDENSQSNQVVTDEKFKQSNQVVTESNIPPIGKQTKPETKIKIEEVANEIKKGKVSDDDAKIVGDALADAIKDGKVAPRVATRTATAVRKSLQTGRVQEPKEIDNFYRLSRHALALQEGLQFWADGTMSPTSEDERQYAKVIRAASTAIITGYARLGIDVVGIFETFYKGESENERANREQIGM